MASEFLYAGELISERGLEPVGQSLAGCSWRIECRRSGFDGTLYLRTPHTQAEIDLEMQTGQSNRFLFSGTIEGTFERALALLREFSHCLAVGGFVHRIEILDSSKELVGYLHLGWPQTAA